MIEAPEALYLSGQLNRTIRGKRITDVIAAYTPHKFAFYEGDPSTYPERLAGTTVREAVARGGMVDVLLSSDKHLLFTDGVNLRYYEPGEKLPAKHQLLIGFEDQSCIVASVRMYGALCCFPEGGWEAPLAAYYESAKRKPQVLSDAFTRDYFLGLINDEKAQKKTAKAFLATGQTIPGLGNGVLQDILYNARIHPKAKIASVPETRRAELYDCIRNTLREMYKAGGRNTETDLFGANGKYVPYLSKDTAGHPCPRCGEPIRKENFLGGSIYYCSECQVMKSDFVSFQTAGK